MSVTLQTVTAARPFPVIYDDQMWSGRASERRKLLYTAVTRAKEKLTIVTGG